MKIVNWATAIWTACIGIVATAFGFLSFGNYSAVNPAPGWIVWPMISAVGIGILAFIVMTLASFVKVAANKRNKNTYKGILGISTGSYFTYGILILLITFLLIARISDSTSSLATVQLPTPINASFSSPAPSPSTTPKPKGQVIQQPRDDGEPWGVQKQVDDVTWTMKVGHDEVMATPQEIFDALNEYRVRQGVGRLEWNDKLAGLAQLRCDQQVSNGGLDSHAGFKEFTTDQDKMRELGFWDISENASYGYKLSGVHIIEWAYSDPPHDNNQKNPKWNIVGIAVKGTCTDLIFGR